MQDLRYLNLFSKVTRIQTKYCFFYNNAVLFAVPRGLVKRAIGPNADNLKRISNIVKKRIKVVAIPESIKDAKHFIETVISPLTFSNLEITDDEIILTAGSQNKAALIGRNKRRLLEMQSLIRDFFNREFKIV